MYKALYRKWRPQTFDDVISQTHVTDTLKNQITNGKTAHAYLFTGSRGTGKTTCARIFAKALCCPNSHNGNPCLECEICRDAETSRLSDIIEIDAASNNSVEDVRDLREGAVYLPERCKYKVYIIDEVHMLSASAFNALLKIMEEPPEFVKFILATTEIHKVPNTILSRCQRFDFKRILPDDISARLKYIAEQEGFTITDGASHLIAKLSDGGMRDAISLLDQASAFSSDITEEVVSTTAGIAGREYLFEALECLTHHDATKLFELVENLYMQSKNLSVFCDDLLSQLRNVMFIKVAPSLNGSLVCMPSEVERLTQLADSLNVDTILYYMKALERCHERLARCSDKRIELEVSLSQLCSYDGTKSQEVNVNTNAVNPQVENLVSNLMGRINALENEVTNLRDNVQVSNYARPVRNNVPKRNPVEDAEFKKLKSEDFKRVNPQVWQSILDELQRVSPGLHSTLIDSCAHVGGKYVLITTRNKMFTSLYKKDNHLVTLGGIINRVLGGNFNLKSRYLEPDTPNTNFNNSNSTQNIGSNSFGDLIERAKQNNIPTKQVD
jgi:DNA polymerase-3 subunit gamma/tau